MLDYYSRNRDFFRDLRNVCFYITDPGSWAVLKILAEFMDRCGHRCFFMPEGWALKNAPGSWDSSQTVDLEDWKRGSRLSFHLLVYGAQQHFSKNYEMLAQCRNSGIKTLFVFDSWKNYLVNFRDPLSGVFYLPSRIAVADQAMKAGILSALAGYTEENIESKIDILGQPAIDASISYISSLSPENVASLRKRYNPDRKILRLFIMEPIREDFLQVNQVDPGYDEYTILEYFLTHLCTENSRVLIKVHPRQKRDEFLKSIPFVLRNARKLFMEIEYDEKIEHLIAIADEIYGMTSISLTVAIRCGKKAGSVQVGRNGYGNTLSNPELEKCLIV